MDKHEDFQFKPLTEGLGFHKKTLDLKEDSFASMPVQTGIMPKPKNPAGATSASFGLNRPLTAPTPTPAPVTPARQPMTTVPKAGLGWKPALPNATIIDNKIAPIEYVAISSDWPAAFFDTAMVAGFTLLFSAVVFALTKVEVASLYETLQNDGGLQTASLAIIFAVFEIYTVTCRTFFAKTLGEWVFDVRLGTPAQQKSILYPFQVAWRTIVITLTGFIILPALSSALGEDIAGLLSGLQLFAEKK